MRAAGPAAKPPTRAKPAGFGEAETACGLYPAPCREYKGAPVAQTGALVYLYGWGMVWGGPQARRRSRRRSPKGCVPPPKAGAACGPIRAAAKKQP